tara:strand:+ start:10966 stop:11292 length:327 start_codon:yes stop_codon:yes gene_type:complete
MSLPGVPGNARVGHRRPSNAVLNQPKPLKLAGCHRDARLTDLVFAGVQIVDAWLVPAPKQRNTDDEREAIKAGKSADEIWPNEPAKAAQKDTDARCTLKIGGKVRYRP